MVIRAAAQPGERIPRDGVGQAEGQQIPVERQCAIQVDRVEGDVAELHWPDCPRGQRLLDLLHPLVELQPVPVRVQVADRLTDPGMVIFVGNGL